MIVKLVVYVVVHNHPFTALLNKLCRRQDNCSVPIASSSDAFLSFLRDLHVALIVDRFHKY